MPHVLHVIESLDKNEVAQAAISTAKQSARFGPYTHSFVSLKPASTEMLEMAKNADIEVTVNPSVSHLDALIDDADMLQVEYWNAPALNEFLHMALPPHRLAIWFHISGHSLPQKIHQTLFDFADLPIACATVSLDEHPVFIHSKEQNPGQESALVISPANFDNLKSLTSKSHEGFNIGYIGNLDFATMHQDFIPMHVNIQIPDASFIICGEGDDKELKRQAATFNADHRFDFRGAIEDISSILSVLDVFGFPLTENTSIGAPISLQEVMYAGIPPIVFPHGGIKGMVQHNRTGLFVSSQEDYRRAIEYLYYNPVERKRLGVNAAAYARAHFGAKNAARAINKIYDRLIKIPKRYHAWGKQPQQFAPRLSNKTPEDKSAALIFTQSLGADKTYFSTSLHSSEVKDQLEADRQIAKSSEQVFLSGILPYQKHFYEDPHLNMWAGLCQENQGLFAEALSSFQAIPSSEVTGWRSQWYLGRVHNTLGNTEKAHQIYATLRKQVPDFDELAKDDSFLTPPTELPGLSSNTVLTQELEEEEEVQPTTTLEESPIMVTAIVSTYNAETFMDGCLQNLVHQTLYKQGLLEIIVIDACSEENEKEIVERYQAQHDNIVYVRAEKRETLYASWNRAIKLARGRYITNANTDDRHRHDAYEKLGYYLEDYPEIALTYPGQIDTSVPNETFENTTSTKILDWPVYSYQELQRHCIIGSQPMWRKSLHDTYGLFRDSFQAAGDYEFWLRIGKDEQFFRYPEVLGLYYRNPEGIEHGSNVSQKEAIQVWTEYGMFERGIPVILNGRVLTSPEDVLQTGGNETTSTRLPFDTYINEFESHLLSEHFQQAFEVADNAIIQYPELPYPYILKAIALRQLNDFSEAVATLEASLRLEETPEALVELIQLSLATGNLEEAYKTEQYIRDSYPEWSERLPGVQTPKREADTPPPVIAVDNELDSDLILEDTPSSTIEMITIADTSLSSAPKEAHINDELTKPAGLEDLDYSIKSFEELCEEFEQFIKVKDVKHAEELALAATRKFPDNHQAWVLKATTFRMKGSFEEAKKAIQKSLLIQDSPEALIELLELSLSLGDEKEAIQICDAITKSYPEYTDLITELRKQRLSTQTERTVNLSQAIRNFMPLSPEQRDLITADDVGLVSFPGSGCSWLGNLLADMLQQSRGYKTSKAHLALPPSEIIIDLHTATQRSNWLIDHGYDRQIIKTYSIASIPKHPFIYIFRDPLEALISAYHYCKQAPNLHYLAKTSCDSFCLANIENYNQHMNAALLLKKANPDKVLLLENKSLSENPILTLRIVYEFLGLEFQKDIADRAFNNCNLQDSSSINSDFDFLQPGNGLSRTTLDAVVSTLMPVYQEVSQQSNILQHTEPVVSEEELAIGHFV